MRFRAFRCERVNTCIYLFVISAFAAFVLAGTESQTLFGNRPVLRFDDVFAQVGSADNNFVFRCPSTAFYFVHYRLIARMGNFNSLPCVLELAITLSEPIAVRSFVIIDDGVRTTSICRN